MGNKSLARRIRQTWGRKADRLRDFVTGEIHASIHDAENRAHLSTTGDRPFVGCNPCQPLANEMPEPSGENLAAQPRPAGNLGTGTG